MNQGGAPKGKRAATLHKEQVQRELADPSLRHARVQADKDNKRLDESGFHRLDRAATCET
jgi:hypothetical protein